MTLLPGLSPGAAEGAAAPGDDVVPLTRRASAMTAVRLAITGVAVALALLAGPEARLGPFPWLALVGYLAVTGGLSLLVLAPARRLALAGFGTALAVDGLAVQYVHYRLGAALGAGLLVAVLLVAVCLLASFRTGMRMALSQSLMYVVVDRGIATGLFPPPPGRTVADAVLGDTALVRELIPVWLAVLITALAAATSERELRRRRYDAEALQGFASRLHADTDPVLVLRRALRFAVDELEATRALVCIRSGGSLRLVAGHGTADPGPAAAAAGLPATLLDGTGAGRPVLALRTSPLRDPWLSVLMPDARRLIALRIEGGEHPAWLVLEHGRRRGTRVERRIVGTAAQAAATASLALSRARLLDAARRAASTDGLTGVPNRRTFDEELDRLAAPGAGGVALVLVDVDHFKQVNDTWGHQAGDEVLRRVAAALVAAASEGHVVARYGGEEFAVLMPGLTAAAAARPAESLRAAVESIREPVPVTASFGVSATPGGTDLAALVAEADAALYRAKQEGRNRVVQGGPAAVPAPRAGG